MRRAAKIDANQPEIVKALRKVGASVAPAHTWKCLECGYEIESPTKHEARRKYCSNKCVSSAYKSRMAGQENPNFKGVEKVCIGCGRKYRRYGDSKYCTHGCYTRSRTTLEMKPCKGCNDLFRPRTKRQVFCGNKCRVDSSRSKKGEVKNLPRSRNVVSCGHCGVDFHAPPSAKRKYCSYKCHIESGGSKRSGEAAVMAKRKYGAKRDANHKEIFEAIREITAAHDLSDAGFGMPDGLAWVSGGWQLFDVKNPNTAYGRRGLNDVQKKWASDWRGGPVFLIYTVDEARRFAAGDFCGLKRFCSGGMVYLL